MNPQKSKTCEKPRNLYAIDVEVRRFHVVFNACTGFEYYGVLHQRDKTVPDHVDLPSAATLNPFWQSTQLAAFLQTYCTQHFC